MADWRCRFDPEDHAPFRSESNRDMHERGKHGSVHDGGSPQLPLDVSHQEQEVAELTAAVRDLVAKLTPQTITAAPAATESMPTFAQVIAHCEGGQCAAHKAELDEHNAGVIRAAWSDIPPEILEKQGKAKGIIPTSIRFEAKPVGAAR